MSTEAGLIVDNIQAQASPEVSKEIMGGDSKDAIPQPTHQPEQRVSGKFEALIRREQQARQRELAAQTKEKELETKLQRIADFEASRTDPKKALELLGLNYDELTQSLLKDGSIPPEVEIRKVNERLDSFEKQKEQDRLERLESDKRLQEQRESHAVTTFKGEIGQYLKDNKARYELTMYEDASELVYDVVDEHYNRTLKSAQEKFANGELTEEQVVGKVLSVAEACDKVEEHFEKKYQKAKELEKTKTLWGAIPKAMQQELAKPVIKQNTPPPKTLTNNLSATPMKPNPRPPEEQRVKAILADFLARKG